VLSTGKIGNRSGDLLDAMPATRGELEPFGGLGQQGMAVGIQTSDRFQQLTFRAGIDVDAGMPGITLGLDRAGDFNPCGDSGRTLGRRRQGEISGGDLGHVDVKIDAVEHRTRDPHLIICSAARRTRAGTRGIGKTGAQATIQLPAPSEGTTLPAGSYVLVLDAIDEQSWQGTGTLAK